MMTWGPRFQVDERVGFRKALTGELLPGVGRVIGLRRRGGSAYLYRVRSEDTDVDLGWFGGRELRPVADVRPCAGRQGQAGG